MIIPFDWDHSEETDWATTIISTIHNRAEHVCREEVPSRPDFEEKMIVKWKMFDVVVRTDEERRGRTA